jgi:hypothetical protein
MTIRERLFELADTRVESAWIERVLTDVRGGESISRQRAWEQFHERRARRARLERLALTHD